MPKQPMLPTLIEKPFDDGGWLFELKWDGIRALCALHGRGSYELISRNRLSLNHKFPELAGLDKDFARAPLVIDGEIHGHTPARITLAPNALRVMVAQDFTDT